MKSIGQQGGVSRRAFVKAVTTAGAVGSLPALGMSLPATKTPQTPMAKAANGAPRPNIIYIHSHDSGRMLSPYGHSADTPHLMKLAQKGILFRQAYTGAPTCSPSRACLLTGQTPHEAGMLGLVNYGFHMDHLDHHLCHTLHNAGYHTVLAGLQHIAKKPEMIGFDQIIPHDSTSVADVTPGAVSYIERKPRQPFFMDCGFYETHRLFKEGRTYGYLDVTPLDNPNYVHVPSTLNDVKEVRLDIAGFDSDARVLDSGVGRVMQALEDAGLAENTIVISTTDHGISFPLQKCNLLDPGMGVSMIMRGPKPFAGGTVCDALVSQIDIYPTLCDFLRIRTPIWCQGKSFMPVMTGAAKEINEAVYSEVNYHACYEPKRAVRTTRYKYIKRYNGRTTDAVPNCDWSRSKEYWVSKGWVNEKLAAAEELYDLVFDSGERNNLAADPGHAAVLNDMRQKLVAWQHRTSDPLLKGPIPLPQGAHALSPDGVGRIHYGGGKPEHTQEAGE